MAHLPPVVCDNGTGVRYRADWAQAVTRVVAMGAVVPDQCSV